MPSQAGLLLVFRLQWLSRRLTLNLIGRSIKRRGVSFSSQCNLTKTANHGC